MAVHVLALLAYKEGDRVTSAFLAGSINTNPVIVRRLLLALQRAKLVDTCKGAGAGSGSIARPGDQYGAGISGGGSLGIVCHGCRKARIRIAR